jgi:hypothetical protein
VLDGGGGGLLDWSLCECLEFRGRLMVGAWVCGVRLGCGSLGPSGWARQSLSRAQCPGTRSMTQNL